MSNSAEQLIWRAVTLLEESDDADTALAVLDEAISVAGLSRRTLELIRAKILRGELLVQMGRKPEASADFQDVIALAELFDEDRQLVDEEVAAAKDWLQNLEG